MKILHLYHDLMNLYGEYGNVVCLKKHLEDQGIEVVLERKSIGDTYNICDYDFIYCGSGLESNLKVAIKDLSKHKDELIKAIEDNKYILFTGNAMEMLGDRVDDEEALGIVKLNSKTVTKRYTGDVIVTSSEFGELVGFINKSTLIEQDEKIGLFNYIFKDANLNDGSLFEGYKLNNLIGTHIIGPILVKNPRLMKYYVEGMGKSNKDDFIYKDVKYPYEEESYEVTLNALKERIK